MMDTYPNISTLTALQIFDSRGNPTVAVTLRLDNGQFFQAQVPAGASKGSYEAHELRDGGVDFGGLGVSRAVEMVNNEISPALITCLKQKRFTLVDQKLIDQFLCDLDGTNNKERLGANSILAVSMTCARAGAALLQKELFEYLAILAEMPTDHFVLPVPFMNQINGGIHCGNSLAMQEFMVAPIGARTFRHAMQINTEIYHALKKTIAHKYGKAATALGDEGGFAPPLNTAEEAFDLLERATCEAGYTVMPVGVKSKGHVAFGLDPASSEFFDKNSKTYDLGFKVQGKTDNISIHAPKKGLEMVQLYRTLLEAYSIVLLEDPFAEDDFESWKLFMDKCPSHVEVVGDDLLATNPERILLASSKQLCNSLLLKINQIGTISEAIGSAKMAYEKGWSVFVSHRSGETTDDFIADLSVAIRAGHLKSGAPARGERIAKYNRLLAIEEILESREGVTCEYAKEYFRYT